MNDSFNVKWKNIIIGQLYKDEEDYFVFEYNIEGLKRAKKNGYLNIIGFSEENKMYKSKKLFAFFVSRVPPKTRVDLDKILENLGLDKYDELEILKKTGGKLITDDFEIEYVNFIE